MDDGHRAVFEHLVEALEAQGVSVKITGGHLYEGDQREGHFDVVTYPKLAHPDYANRVVPQCWIHRDHQGKPGDPLQVVLTLAHEAGHYTSWKKGEPPEGYKEMLVRFQTDLPISEEEGSEIKAEETRAWEYGRDWLAKVDFDGWSAFEHRKARSLEDYDRRIREAIAR